MAAETWSGIGGIGAGESGTEVAEPELTESESMELGLGLELMELGVELLESEPWNGGGG